MKNLALTLAMVVVLAACSSGSTVSPLPSTVSSQFEGTFKNINNTQNGTVRLNIVEDESSSVSGNVIFQSTGDNCLRNATVSGTSTGFNLELTTGEMSRDEYTIVTVVTRSDGSSSTSTRTSSGGTVGTVSRTDANGNTTTTTTTVETLTGTVDLQLAIGNNGNALSGTYVTEGEICSNRTGSGDMTMTRTGT